MMVNVKFYSEINELMLKNLRLFENTC